MGATGWKYFVPYQTNIDAGLQRLRKHVFSKGQYIFDIGITRSEMESALKVCGSDTESMLQRFSDQASDPKSPVEIRKKFAALVQQIKQLNDSKMELLKPNTIEELLERQGESGTHSILDITRVSDVPGFGTVNPLPSSKLLEIFGTQKPSHAQIESTYEEGALERYVRERWQGIYIIAYREGSPDEIFFAGCSGD